MIYNLVWMEFKILVCPMIPVLFVVHFSWDFSKTSNHSCDLSIDPVWFTANKKTSLLRKWFVGCNIGGAKSKETGKVLLQWGLIE